MTPHCKHEPRPLPAPGRYVRGECFSCWLAVNHPAGHKIKTAPPAPPVDPAKPWDVAYLLNLKRRPDRLAFALGELASVGIEAEVFEALDGHAVPLPDGWTAGAGAYGCMMGHHRMLEKAILAGANSVLLLEDDLKFMPHFRERFAEFMSRVPPDWDCLYLGGQFMGDAQEVVPGVLKPIGPDGIHRTQSLILRGQYMHRVYSMYGASMGHCDHVIGKSHTQFKVYAPDPWLTVQASEAGRSDINGRTYTQDRAWTPKRVIRTGVEPGATNIKPTRNCGTCRKGAA